jgi:anti-sigma regulatory factor (Ser/Thr protein kinase)
VAVPGASAGVAVDDGAHVVQFYGRDSEMLDVVGSYLADAIAAGDVAIAVATASHRVALEEQLAAAGIDPTAAQAKGDLLLLDAAETMNRFLVDGAPDPAAFDRVIGSLILDSTRDERPPRVFGEMVALLWEAGQINAALELENLWTELARRLSFTLVCAYSAESVGGAEHIEALNEVCRLHSVVLDESAVASHSRTIRAFASAIDGPRAARRFVAETELIPDALLVVTELATNAVVHARSDFVVVVSPAGQSVRIAVRDSSAIVPTRRQPNLGISGRGLELIDALTTSWDVEMLPEGKEVWAELAR